jgi:pumilio family protein 6
MPAQIASLEETDAIRARTSKKDPEARSAEIRKFASEALLNWITENGTKVAKEPRGSLIVTEIMLYAEGGQTSLLIHHLIRD